MPEYFLVDFRDDDDDDVVVDKLMDVLGLTDTENNTKDYQRDLSVAERRVDFKSINRFFEEDALTLGLKLRGFIKLMEGQTLALISEQDARNLSAEFAQSLRLSTGTEFSRAVEEYLLDTWRRNRDLAIDELPEPVRDKLGNLRRYDDSTEQQYATSFRPDVAVSYLRNRALFIKGIIDDQLTKEVKYQIFEHLKGGRTLSETMGNIREVFEPWVGDPEKIIPSGMTATPEDILQAYRLENIVRTETATAMNMARTAVGDAAEDFVIGYEHSSILDMRTSSVCMLADGIRYRKDDARAVKLQKPLHWNCRSIDAFITTNDVPVEWTSEEDLDEVVREIPKEFK